MTSTAMISTFTLEELPAELLLKVFRTMPFQSAARFARTNKALYAVLIKELYKRTKTRGWFPMGFACATGNTETISRCLEAGASVDGYIPRDVGSHCWADATYYVVGGWRPLREAMHRLHIEAIKFLLINGANPNTTAAEAASGQTTAPPLAYAYRRGAESRRNVAKARAVCMLLLWAGADTSVLDPVKQLELHVMRHADHYIPASWR